ncbi:MAG: phosphoglucosamine mutase, partial [Acidobacteria bacterium]|nr:phosphoglucosamine mutase [Acidobacteriota bacterium]
MARQLFGTDGIRGVAGQYPLDAQTVFAFGRALGEWAAAHEPGAKVLIGMDTRESGPALAGLVTAGLEREGVPYEFAGVIPTPGVAWLTKTGPYAAGLMISASHNPYQDNGLKVFAHSGYKLPDADELTMEGRILALREENFDTPRAAIPASVAGSGYLGYLASMFPWRLDGWKIVVDCGNGAAYLYAGELLRSLGADVTALHCAPDGRNINQDCGSLHTGHLSAAVRAEGAQIGVAFDGDADRAMFCRASGEMIDGDHVMYVCAADAAERGELKGGDVVATVMSNLGLELALRRR